MSDEALAMVEQAPSIYEFGGALFMLRGGHRMRRLGWNATGQYIELQVPDEHSKMRKPYIFIHPVDGELVPWLASQTDMLAHDWVEVPR